MEDIKWNIKHLKCRVKILGDIEGGGGSLSTYILLFFFLSSVDSKSPKSVSIDIYYTLDPHRKFVIIKKFNWHSLV